MILVYIFFIGLALGSFANVYFYRLPRKISVITPFSFCPTCNHPINWYDNIPVVSFLFLKGQCRYCNSKISLKYPFTELLCALIIFLTAWNFRNETFLISAAFVFFSFIVFLIGGIDLITYFESGNQYGIIPDHLLIMLAAAALPFSFLNPLFHGQWWFSLIGGAGGIFFMLTFRQLGQWFFKKEALGLGDVKMMGAAGLWIGWQGMVAAVIIASSIGTVLTLFLMAFKKIDRHSPVPFGPFLALGSLSALFYF